MLPFFIVAISLIEKRVVSAKEFLISIDIIPICGYFQKIIYFRGGKCLEILSVR